LIQLLSLDVHDINLLSILLHIVLPLIQSHDDPLESHYFIFNIVLSVTIGVQFVPEEGEVLEDLLDLQLVV
jgi:hypothetical protein